MAKRRLLSLVQLPPPMHGAAAINESVVQSKTINALFDHRYVPIQLSISLDSVGHFRSHKFVTAARNILRVVWKCLLWRPHVVYFTLPPHGGGFYAALPMVAVIRMLRIQRVFHFHGKGFALHAQRSSLYRKLMNWATAGSHVILLSRRLVHDAEGIVDISRCDYIANFVPPAALEAASVTKMERPFTVLFLSNLVVSKGPLVVLDAAKLLKERGLDIRVKFAGSFHLPLTEENFANEIAMRDLRNIVEYIGPIYGAKKFNLIRSSDVFVLPTFYENEAFPLVILEAMSQSVPVIATNEGAIADMISDGQTGVLLQTANAERLADAIEFLIHNPKELSSMGGQARDLVARQFTYEAFESKLIEIISRASADSE